jgi:NAD(P)-dependent dehydrogenase (short-subunit alcohol dehydrogenase family)
MLDPDEYKTQQQRWHWYGHSKLALHLFTKILDDALLGEKVFVNTVHPGLIAGGAIRHSDECFPPFFGALGVIAGVAARPFMRSAQSGALATLFAATSPTISEV